jgi:RNA polymerase sigma-70 factor (ECF subfamily)
MSVITHHDSIPEATDEELAARRDVTGLYDRYARRLIPFLAARGVAESDLDDVHQEVWVRVWNALGTAAFQGHFRGWLFQVARNLIIDRSRKAPPLAPLPDDSPLTDRACSPAEQLARQEALSQLACCLERLEGKEAALFRGITGGADYDEMCEQLGIGKGAAYKLFHQAKNKLASCMERAGV